MMKSTQEARIYIFALNEEVSRMSAKEFLKWNPAFSTDEANSRISEAKTIVAKKASLLFEAI